MKKWAFIDCLKDVNFENIDFAGYEKVILLSSRDLFVPVGKAKSELELGIIKSDAETQQQMTVVMAYQIGQFDTKTSHEIQFDIYSDDIASPSIDECLRKANRHCKVFKLPPAEKITLSEATDNFIARINSEYVSKNSRPRALSIYEHLLNDAWRPVRGRVCAKQILDQLDSDGAIKHASNGIYFNF